MPPQVPSAADRSLISESAVGSLRAAPVFRRPLAVAVRAAEHAVSPLARHRLVEALELSIGLGAVAAGAGVPEIVPAGVPLTIALPSTSARALSAFAPARRP